MFTLTSIHRKLLFLFVVIMLGFISAWIFIFRPIQKELSPAVSIPPSIVSTSTGTTQQTKTYRNTEWGFEFEYPEDWSFQINRYRSQFSKFELLGDSSAENYNPFNPAFIVHIVTPEFASNATMSFRNLNARISVVTVAGTGGTKYEYEFESIPQIAIDIPFGEYRMLLGADIDHEDDFNKILASFKFLK